MNTLTAPWYIVVYPHNWIYVSKDVIGCILKEQLSNQEYSDANITVVDNTVTCYIPDTKIGLVIEAFLSAGYSTNFDDYTEDGTYTDAYVDYYNQEPPDAALDAALEDHNFYDE